MHLKPLYFKGFNGLRFFAALLVIFDHAPTFITTSSHPNIIDFRGYSFFTNGPRAVDFFFVLSGFLITSLLLKEHDETNTISIRKFYTRRVLRIWPLYYLVVFIAFVVFPILSGVFELAPDPGLGSTQLLLYLFILPNAAFMFGPQLLLSPLWSIGVEEQFYLLVAPVIKYCRKNLAIIFFAVIIIKTLVNLYVDQYYPGTHLRAFIVGLRFEIISIGCLGALFVRSRFVYIIKPLFTYWVQVLVFTLLFLILFFNVAVRHTNFLFINTTFDVLLGKVYSGLITGLLFLYVLLCVSFNDKSLLKTENRLLNKLGNVSYGMYMFHVMTCFVVAAIMKHLFIGMPVVSATVLYYVLCVVCTVTVAFLSYHFFEKHFLLLKQRFEH